MAIQTKFSVDLRDWQTKLKQADVQLTAFGRTSRQFNNDLSKFGNQFSSSNIVKHASLTSKAIGDIGNVAKLTDRQLSQARAHISEYMQAASRGAVQATPEIKKLSAEIERLHASNNKPMGGGTGSVGSFLLGMAGGFAAAAASAAISKIAAEVTELAKAGTRLTPLRQSFDRLYESPQQATAAIAHMRRQTRGLVDDLDLITTANRAAFLGVNQMGVDVAAVMRDAQAAGRAMGVESAEAVERVLLSMAKMNGARLDELGIIITIGESNEWYSKQIEKSVSLMTEQEKRTGFALLTQQKLAEKAKEAGDNHFTAAEEAGRISTQLGSVITRLVSAVDKSERLRDILGGVADKLAEVIDIIDSGKLGATIRVGVSSTLDDAIKTRQEAWGGLYQYTPLGMASLGGLQTARNMFAPSAADIQTLLAPPAEPPKPTGKAGGKSDGPTAPTPDEIAAQRRYNDEIARLTGQSTIAAAEKLAEQLGKITKAGGKVPTKDVDKLVQTLQAAEDVARDTGRAIDGSVRKAIEALREPLRDVDRLISRVTVSGDLQSLMRSQATRNAFGATPMHAFGGSAAAIKSSNPLSYILGNQYTAMSSDMPKLVTHTQAWNVEIGKVVNGFAQLAQITGELEGLVRGIGAITGAINLGGEIGNAIKTQKRDAHGNLLFDASGKPIMGTTGFGRAVGSAIAGGSVGLQLGAMTTNAWAGGGMGALGGGAAGLGASMAAGAKFGSMAGWVGAGIGALGGALGGIYSAQSNKKAQYAAKDAGMAQILAQYGGDLDTLLDTVGGVGLNQEEFLRGWYGDPKAFTKQTELLTTALAKEEAQVTKLGKSLDAASKSQRMLTREQMEALTSTRADGPGEEMAQAFREQQRAAGTAGAIRAAQAIVRRHTAEDGSLLPVTDFQAGGRASAAALLASMGAMRAEGMLTSDILRGDVGQSLAGLESLGIGGAAVSRLASMRDIITGDQTGAHVDVAEGLGQSLAGLTNAGLMDSTLFAELTAGITESAQALEALGVGGEQSMHVLSQPLQAILDSQREFGFEVDEATQKLLDQAVAAGAISDKLTPEEKMAESVAEMTASFQRFLDDLPGAMAEAVGGMQRSLDTLHMPSLKLPGGDGGGGGGGEYDQLSEGGIVNYPTSGRLAMLHGKEWVIPDRKVKNLLRGIPRIANSAFAIGAAGGMGGGPIVVHSTVAVDGRAIGRASAKYQPETARAFAR